jgi:hypothetical protein
MGQGEGQDARLHGRARPVGHLRRAALAGSEDLQAVAGGLAPPAVVGGVVDAERPAGGAGAAELLRQGQRAQAKAVQDSILGHGGDSLGAVW